MFGYVVPDKPNMLIKDFNLFKAYYCGLCKSIGKEYGQLPRFSTNYDSAFLYAFVQEMRKERPTFENKGCVLSPLKKKTSVVHNSTAAAIVDFTVIMGYFKAEDDVLDEGGVKKRTAKSMFRGAMKKASKRQPVIRRIVENGYSALRALEKEGCDCIDKVADCFASTIRDSVKILLGENSCKNTDNLCYNLGKWVYLIDAVDDLQADAAAGRYNPVEKALGKFTDKQTYLKQHAEELSFLLNTAYNAVVDNYDAIEININEGVLSNVIYMGMKAQTQSVLEGKERCKIIRL